MLSYFPKYFTGKAIWLYIIALFACNIIFMNRALPIIWWAFGLVEVVGFFYFSNRLTNQWQKFSIKKFPRELFQTALIIRVVWVLFSYFFYSYMTGQPFEFDTGDAFNYHQSAQSIAALISNGHLQQYFDRMGGHYSDTGFPFYMGWLYWITGNSIIIARLIKALIGAYTCVLIYKLATRNFGEQVGRMSAIFCMLMPNLIFYCGLHLKEVEMVFLTVAFMERADLLFRNKKFNFMELAPPLLLAGSLFFFRTVLGATALFALFTTVIFSSDKVMGMGKRTLLIVWVLGTVVYFSGSKISNEIDQVWESRAENQSTSMDWRSERKGGNEYSKYASGVVFAPLIFVIPFPTIIETPKQQNQKIINGGNYVKNIMAFFVLFALVWIIRNKKWREYVLMGSFVLGYLAVIALSAFAQSERFHQPALPFELIFAAFGVSLLTNKSKKYFSWWMVFIFVAIVAWSWFKLAGRGLA